MSGSPQMGPIPAPASAFRRLRSPWAVGLLLMVVVATLGWLIFYSPVFSARTIIVVGAEQVTDDQVLKAAAIPQNLALARLPLGTIADRVEQLDPVASAQVKREWPDTIRIVVTERRAVAVLATESGFGIVGSDGSVYRTESSRPPGLPLLERLSSTAATTTSGSTDDAAIAAFEVASSLPNSLLRKVDQVTASSVRTVHLVLRNGSLVEWGSAIESQRKAQVLVALLRHNAPRYNVSVPDAPAWSG
jgi:cell division protein FtsQ